MVAAMGECRERGGMKRRFLFDGLECRCRIGAHDHERDAAQRVVIDAEIQLDAKSEPERDELGATLDYDIMRSTILEIAMARHYDLQETLARAIFDALSGLAGVVGVRVRTAKPDAYADCRQVAYELSDIE